MAAAVGPVVTDPGDRSTPFARSSSTGLSREPQPDSPTSTAAMSVHHRFIGDTIRRKGELNKWVLGKKRSTFPPQNTVRMIPCSTIPNPVAPLELARETKSS